MDDFSELMNDKISIFDQNEKLVVENISASVSGKNILIGSGDFIVDFDYIVERKLPNGHVEKYRVIDPDFFAGMDGMPAHYDMKVENLKKRSSPTQHVNQTTINYTLSGNSRFYKDSTDSSINTYNAYNLSQYQNALDNIKSEAQQLGLPYADLESLERSIQRIDSELRKDNPNKEIIKTCLEFFPPSVMALQSFISLGQMFGLG